MKPHAGARSLDRIAVVDRKRDRRLVQPQLRRAGRLEATRLDARQLDSLGHDPRALLAQDDDTNGLVRRHPRENPGDDTIVDAQARFGVVDRAHGRRAAK